jgi:CheY-like chemotaxis protein
LATILVVEDTLADREVATILLRAPGHIVVGVETGEAGWAHLQRERPDLVLVDIMLPGMNGLELVERLRTEPQFARVPVVFYTAWYDEPATQRALRTYSYPVLMKPIESHNAFVAQIEACLPR